MYRYFIYLSFDGRAYHGWQIQPNGITVEEALEKALSTLLHTPIDVTGAGRTDAGVNARLMVAHFDLQEPLELPLDCHQLAYRLNKMLPRDISVSQILPVPSDLHARFSAKRRTYHYYIHTRKDPFRRAYSHEIHYALDFDQMNAAAQMLVGTRDFQCFCKAGSDVKTTVCDLYEARWDHLDGEAGASPSPPTASCATWCAPWWAPWWRWVADASRCKGWRRCSQRAPGATRARACQPMRYFCGMWSMTGWNRRKMVFWLNK